MSENHNNNHNAKSQKTHKPMNPNRRRTLYLSNLVLLCTVTLIALAAAGIFLYSERQTARGRQDLQDQLDALEGQNKTLYTAEELSEAREDARKEGAREERGRIKMQIQSDMESGGSTASMLRKLFSDDIVIVSGGKYYFYPIMTNVPKNTYESGDFELNEAGRLIYKGKGNAAVVSGLDVSEGNGGIDWNAVAEDDCAFAMVCAGGRDVSEDGDGNAAGNAAGAGATDAKGLSSEEAAEAWEEKEKESSLGKIVEDSLFEANVNGASDAGLQVGVYWNLGAVSQEEAQEEADHLVKQMAGLKGKITYPVAVCVNVPADTDRTVGQGRAAWTSYVKTFLKTVSDAGYQTELYGNLAGLVMLTDVQDLQNVNKWISNSGANLYYPYEFRMWQYSTNGTVQGISGEVRLDALLTEKAEDSEEK